MSEDAPYVPEPVRRADEHPLPPPAPLSVMSGGPRSPRADDLGATAAGAQAKSAPDAGPAADSTMNPAGALGSPRPDLREEVVEVLQRIFDPEIPVNIYDLGLVYGIDVSEGGAVEVKMTLTSPSCPVAETLPPEVEQKVRLVEGVTSSKVNLVWEPPWGKHLLSEAARLQLGMD